MKLIDISTPKHPNTFAMVDDADFDWLNQWKWHASPHRKTMYAKRTIWGKPQRITPMHREILSPSNSIGVDHIDGNGLNNQKSNLRIASASENNKNRSRMANNTSGYIGVHWDKQNKRWKAQIRVDGARLWFLSKDLIEAAKARDAAAIKYHGEFAKLNFPISQGESLP